jgi:uncharacterized membrane protein YgcG
MMKRSFALLLLAAVCCSASSEVSAQALSLKQWVKAEEGLVHGVVVSGQANGVAEGIAGVDVYISRRGEETLHATTDSEGRFAFENVDSGVYAMSVWQDRLLAASALQVIDASDDIGGRYPSSTVVSTADVDRPTIKTALIRYLPAGVRTPAQILSDVDLDGLAGKLGSPGNSIRIAQSNGGLVGRLYLAGANADNLQGAAMSNVFILQDGDQIDRALTDQTGAFVFEDLKPGLYSMLAIGPGGVGLIGFELTSESIEQTAARLEKDGEQLVRKLEDASDELSMQLAPVPEAVDSLDGLMGEPGEAVDGIPLVLDGFNEPVLDGCCTPLCGGGMSGGSGSGSAGGGGGFGGGGGGGFGGGGLSGVGALVGIAALAAVGSDDNAVFIPRPASPVLPE